MLLIFVIKTVLVCLEIAVLLEYIKANKKVKAILIFI